MESANVAVVDTRIEPSDVPASDKETKLSDELTSDKGAKLSDELTSEKETKLSDELTSEKVGQSEVDRVGASLTLLEISPVVDSGSSRGVADVAAVDGGPSSRRKLIILDVNGLLGDVVRRRIPGGASFSGGTSEMDNLKFP